MSREGRRASRDMRRVSREYTWGVTLTLDTADDVVDDGDGLKMAEMRWLNFEKKDGILVVLELVFREPSWRAKAVVVFKYSGSRLNSVGDFGW
jgi:hypothetical protein